MDSNRLDPIVVAKEIREACGYDCPAQEENETAEQYGTLIVFWSLGEGRSLQKLAERLGLEEPRPCWGKWKKPIGGDWDNRIYAFECEKAAVLARRTRRAEAEELARRRKQVLKWEWQSIEAGQHQVESLLSLPAVTQKVKDDGRTVEIKGQEGRVKAGIDAAVALSKLARLHVGMTGEIGEQRLSETEPDDEALASLLDLADKM